MGTIRALFRGVLCLCLGFLTACGGGGGGDDDGFFDPDLSFLPQYAFSITNPAGQGDALTVTSLAPGQANDVYTVDAGVSSVRGTVDSESGEFFVSDATSFTVNWTAGGAALGLLGVAVTQEVRFPEGNFLPDSGALAVTFGTDIVAVVYGFSEVSVTLNQGAASVFTPVAFVGLDSPSSSAPDWQQAGVRASKGLTTLLSRVRTATPVLEEFLDGAFDAGPQVSACDLIPGQPPDPGVAQQGELVITKLSSNSLVSELMDCFAPSGSGQPIGALTMGTAERTGIASTSDSGGTVRTLSVERLELDLDTRIITETSPMVWEYNGFGTLVTGGFRFGFSPP